MNARKLRHNCCKFTYRIKKKHLFDIVNVPAKLIVMPKSKTISLIVVNSPENIIVIQLTVNVMSLCLSSVLWKSQILVIKQL